MPSTRYSISPGSVGDKSPLQEQIRAPKISAIVDICIVFCISTISDHPVSIFTLNGKVLNRPGQPELPPLIIFIAKHTQIELFSPIMTKKTKEAIKTSAVIVLVVLAVFALWIYPLNQAGKIVVRSEIEPPIIDFAEEGLIFDSLSILTEDNITVSGMLFSANEARPDSEVSTAGSQEAHSIRGTFFLVHGLYGGSWTQLSKARVLIKEGFNVVIFDQRAFGHTEGDNCSGGFFEGNDLQAVISRLDLENRIVHPVIVWGEDHGATAALRAWDEEDRIDYVVMENAVVDGRDWQKRIIKHKDLSAPNILLSLIWWWMKQDTGYEIPIDETDISDFYGTALERKPGRLLPVACGDEGIAANSYVAELQEMGGEWLIVSCEGTGAFEDNKSAVFSRVVEFVSGR
jgi:pimeloyl-ACP methyl ester carboxylesterase